MPEPVLPPEVRTFLAATATCVVGTTRADGSVRQSVTYYVLDDPGSERPRVVVSTVASRAKARDVARTGRMSVCVFGTASPFPCVTVEGDARIRRDDIGELSRRIVREAIGLPAELEPTDEQLAGADRVLLELTPTRSYGAAYLPA